MKNCIAKIHWEACDSCINSDGGMGCDVPGGCKIDIDAMNSCIVCDDYAEREDIDDPEMEEVHS